MRTTFSPTPKVDRAIRERARREGKSISEIVNLLIEEALSGQTEGTQPYRVKTRALGLKPGIDPEKLGELLHELEIDER